MASSRNSPDFFVSPLNVGSTLFSCRNATISKTVQSDSAKRVHEDLSFLKKTFFFFSDLGLCDLGLVDKLSVSPSEVRKRWLTFVGAHVGLSWCPLSAPWTPFKKKKKENPAFCFWLGRNVNSPFAFVQILFAQKTPTNHPTPPPPPPPLLHLLLQPSDSWSRKAIKSVELGFRPTWANKLLFKSCLWLAVGTRLALQKWFTRAREEAWSLSESNIKFFSLFASWGWRRGAFKRRVAVKSTFLPVCCRRRRRRVFLLLWHLLHSVLYHSENPNHTSKISTRRWSGWQARYSS